MPTLVKNLISSSGQSDPDKLFAKRSVRFDRIARLHVFNREIRNSRS
jgi:hypothetical protein